MNRQLLLLSIVSLLSIAGMTMLIGGLLDDMNATGQAWYLRTESGVEVLQGPMPTGGSCSNTVNCYGQSTYACCNHDGSSCIVPSPYDQDLRRCPSSHRSRCICGEAYDSYLEERYG